ncbi:ArsR/SmtB family transcription factor [Streptomyces sp. NPDC058382]|uniref:ArsR/SmtB family transcription factor n=1 Tax=unclassified Streptomyces TaxID=2593676 RepID=UPI0036345115
MPADELTETLHVTTDAQLRAVSNLTRHRIMAVLRFEPATITQVAERVGLAKGSSSYHVRLLERAGLVKVVRTRKVRGVTERYYAMAARSIVLPDPGPGQPDVLMRNAVADLEAAPVDGERHVRMAHLRLTEEQFAELGARLEALADEYRELSDPSLPDVSLAFALFRPAPREQAEEGSK